MKKIIVTGGAGFIGSHLVVRLVEEGNDVTVIDNFSTGSLENLAGINCKIVKANIVDPLPEIEHDVLFHLAAPVSVAESLQDPDKYHNQIGDGTANVVNWSIRNGATSVVVASTAAVYGDTQDLPLGEDRNLKPMSPYADAKLMSENIVEDLVNDFKINGTVLRFFNVFGEGQRDEGGYLSVIPIFRKLWEQNRPLTIRGDGNQTRDFIWVEDVVDALVKAHLFGKGFNVYNVGSGEETSVIQIAEAFGGEVHYIPSIPEPRRSLSCTTKIQQDLNWKSTTSVENWIETIR
jgi:UDP-glucose 4-epimerase